VKRARKVHVQLELQLKRDKNGQLRGGKREGAGRKRKPGRPAEPHGKRPVLQPDQPVHVVLRVLDDVRELRTRDMFMAVREAAIMTFHNMKCRIVHVSIQEGHLHLLVEADDTEALSRGMQGFKISAAKHINAAATARGRKRKGKVFADRYHAEIITCPTQAHHALSYVLKNASHCTSRGKWPQRGPFSRPRTYLLRAAGQLFAQPGHTAPIDWSGFVWERWFEPRMLPRREAQRRDGPVAAYVRWMAGDDEARVPSTT